MNKMFNVTGERRKELVKALTEILEVKSRYCGMPSCAYEIGELTVDKDGTVIGDISDETLRILSERGFTAETQEEKISEPLTFDSDAKEIQHYAKQILSDGQAYSAKYLKAVITEMAGRSFSVGAYAGAFRELLETDCHYCTEERGSYRYMPFECDESLLPFLSILVSMNAKLMRIQGKTPRSNPAYFDMSHVTTSITALIGGLRKSE